jgi:hypothetical protein
MGVRDPSNTIDTVGEGVVEVSGGVFATVFASVSLNIFAVRLFGPCQRLSRAICLDVYPKEILSTYLLATRHLLSWSTLPS